MTPQKESGATVRIRDLYHVVEALALIGLGFMAYQSLKDTGSHNQQTLQQVVIFDKSMDQRMDSVQMYLSSKDPQYWQETQAEDHSNPPNDPPPAEAAAAK